MLKRVLIFAPFLLFFYYVLLNSGQRISIENGLFRFAFEAVYNWMETGNFVTSSSNVTLQAFYFPLNDETIAFGHGIDGMSSGIYTWTDAGYMRNLIFGGVGYLAVLIIYQALYFIQPISVAKSRKDEKEGRIDMVFFIILFLFILIVHVKDNALGLQHLTETMYVLLGSTYLTRHYAKVELTKKLAREKRQEQEKELEQ
jgi:membrane protein insertase Oxa1/YidC/SpoIIIJ